MMKNGLVKEDACDRTKWRGVVKTMTMRNTDNSVDGDNIGLNMHPRHQSIFHYLIFSLLFTRLFRSSSSSTTAHCKFSFIDAAKNDSKVRYVQNLRLTYLVVVVLPDPFRGMGARRNSAETQQSGHAPRSGP